MDPAKTMPPSKSVSAKEGVAGWTSIWEAPEAAVSAAEGPMVEEAATWLPPKYTDPRTSAKVATNPMEPRMAVCMACLRVGVSANKVRHARHADGKNRALHRQTRKFFFDGQMKTTCDRQVV